MDDTADPVPTAAETTDGAGRVYDLTTAALSSLSRAERRVASALLADYPSAGLTSAARLAERAGVSAPTVLRFSQSLGFEGFADLQQSLRSELSARSTGPISRLRDAAPPAADPDGVVAAAVAQGRAQVDLALAALAAVPTDTFEAAVALLADTSRRLLLVGGRFSSLLASNLALHLEQLRPGVRYLGDPLGRDLGAVVDLGRRDVLVVFDYHRYQHSAAELATAAHHAGATVLLVTDDHACPVSRDASVVLAVPSTVGSAYQSMAGGYLLTELLLPAVIAALGEPARTRMALWEQHRVPGLLP
ncbi:MurR/RpiR family transcriptional regulator [Nocardioides sp. GY 10127]|uniref:MurR/RpiR family transcriptional regulator n=1 Tax=Nocardioides sp. GY 10127 TaxID=2569762 RepID=UPI0010A77F04|nr:MurR/RpiR family transcriptional regulator [Nocardioides sp. GY 10127]TIC79274.1 MurR/RpiR family transcriptional regulator [Nocardioides sp. GY 10127]